MWNRTSILVLTIIHCRISQVPTHSTVSKPFGFKFTQAWVFLLLPILSENGLGRLIIDFVCLTSDPTDQCLVETFTCSLFYNFTSFHKFMLFIYNWKVISISRQISIILMKRFSTYQSIFVYLMCSTVKKTDKWRLNDVINYCVGYPKEI